MKKYILLVLFIAFGLPILAQSNWNSTIVEKEKIEAELKIYPNPCKSSKVTVDLNSKEISEISLTNITGKQVFLKKYDFPTRKTQVQLREIPNGIYLIRVKMSDNKVVVKKLMVSKN